jgi:hypothetical protein
VEGVDFLRLIRMSSLVRAVGAVICSVTFAAAGQSARQNSAENSQSSSKNDASSQVYRNAEFGFRYELPYGWVDRTKEMGLGNADLPADGKAKETVDSRARDRAEVLLAIFEHPPEASTNTVNSSVVIASESVASYPGLKDAEDYVAPLTEVVTAQGFKAVGEPNSIEVDSRALVRADFVKTLHVKTTGEELTMRQTTLIWVTKKRVLSFTFISDSEDRLDEIMDGLHFSSPKSSAR